VVFNTKKIMPEQQNIEYKSTWHEDYLKWVCGFANAQGGVIFIGKDDNGNVVGVEDFKKLMDDIPNKLRNSMGITAEVNLHQENGKHFIEIVTTPYTVPISIRGRYYYRSGSTKQELTGNSLNEFLLKKSGKTWDSIPVAKISANELKHETFDFFRKKAIKSRRLAEDSLNDNNELLLENLKLTDNEQIKRAGILLFHPDPERYITGAFIKIGYFATESELLFQDEVHGNLFEQVEKTMEILFTKYFKAFISYEGINRVETYEYPWEAIREALLNAVAHKDYSGLTPIQIRIYQDKIMIWNEARLPENWTIETLLETHSSKPFNPDIAKAFFRSGYIESWGRGISRMTEQCIEAGLPAPLYYFKSSGIWVEFRKDIYNKEDLKDFGLNERQIKAVLYTKGNGTITNSEYQKINDIGRTTATEDLKVLVEKGLFEQIGKVGKGTKYKLK
jgi:ATP-dependent DNA helicase RecG